MGRVQFPIESVREVARVLVEANLGEITLERPASDGAPAVRLSLKRAGMVFAAPAPLADSEFEALAPTESAPEVPAVQVVAAPCVGLFRAAKNPLEVGTRVSKKQILGVVESLRVPNEVYAPDNGVVAQILVADGQAVEWGQPLMEIAPAPLDSDI